MTDDPWGGSGPMLQEPKNWYFFVLSPFAPPLLLKHQNPCWETQTWIHKCFLWERFVDELPFSAETPMEHRRK